LLPFVGFGEAQKIVIRRIRERLESTLGLPVLVTRGPGYLHSVGQIYKGGPPKGLFLQLTAAQETIWAFQVRTIPLGSCNSRWHWVTSNLLAVGEDP